MSTFELWCVDFFFLLRFNRPEYSYFYDMNVCCLLSPLNLQFSYFSLFFWFFFSQSKLLIQVNLLARRGKKLFSIFFLVPFRNKRQFSKEIHSEKKVSSHLTFIHHYLITLIPFPLVIAMPFMIISIRLLIDFNRKLRLFLEDIFIVIIRYNEILP